MCRLFGTIGKMGVDAERLLFSAPQSLFRQSRIDPKRPQGDGWGIGWVEKGRAVVVKSPKAMYREAATVRRAARRVKGNVLVGHVRWASNPLKLPKNRLIGLAHTQPFRYKKWIFAHNGTLLIPKEVRAALGPLAKEIKGNNDSEVLFYWLLKHWRAGSKRQIVAGVRESVRQLDAVWKTCRKKYPLYKYPYHGLNWVLTNGKMLIAMCYVNAGGFGKAKALGERGAPYYQLRYKQTGEGWVVASEPLDKGPGWKAFGHGQLLIADARQGDFF